MSDLQESVHHREPPQVEGGMDSLKEWASEGESKIVDETERRLRYQIGHMTVCDERIREVSSRVAPQEKDSCPSIGLGRVFLCTKIWERHIPIQIAIT